MTETNQPDLFIEVVPKTVQPRIRTEVSFSIFASVMCPSKQGCIILCCSIRHWFRAALTRSRAARSSRSTCTRQTTTRVASSATSLKSVELKVRLSLVRLLLLHTIVKCNLVLRCRRCGFRDERSRIPTIRSPFRHRERRLRRWRHGVNIKSAGAVLQDCKSLNSNC